MPRKRSNLTLLSAPNGPPDPDGSVGFVDKVKCDTCANPAQIVVSDLMTRDVSVLCWPCNISMAIAVAQKLTETAEAEANNDIRL